VELDFQAIRSVQYEILLTVDEIFSAIDFKYFLDFGTLLGARRHKGFIPWDDDIDIATAPANLRSFCTDGSKLLPEHLIVVPHPVFPPALKIVDTRYSIIERSKLHASGTHCISPGIDLFPFGYYRRLSRLLPTNTVGRIAQKRPTAGTRARVMLKQNPSTAVTFLAIAGIPTSLLSSFEDLVQIEPGHNWMNGDPDLLVGHTLAMGTGIRSLPHSAVFPLQTIEFEKREFLAPKDTDAYLTKLYGDWRRPVEYPHHVLKAWKNTH